MSKNPYFDLPTVPGASASPLAPEQDCGRWFFDPVLGELCKKTRNKSDLSRDEVLLLALAAGQAALARYVEPDSAHDAEATINSILSVLDHQSVVTATRDKADELLKRREATEQAGRLAAEQFRRAAEGEVS